MDGTAPACEIYFRDLHDSCFFFGEGEFNEYYIKTVVDKRDGLPWRHKVTLNICMYLHSGLLTRRIRNLEFYQMVNIATL